MRKKANGPGEDSRQKGGPESFEFYISSASSLQELIMYSLEERRRRGDMIETFKYMKNMKYLVCSIFNTQLR